MVIDSSILSLFPQGTDTTSTLLNALYGTGASSGSSGGDPVAALALAEANETKDVAAQAAEPSTARDIAGFTAALAAAKTPADLLSNPTALKVLLTANGLGDQVAYSALAKKALLSDTTQTGNLASTLSNTTWLSVAKTYDFANQGLAVLKTASVASAVTSGYAEVQWRTSLDATTPGLSNALDFRSRATTISSVDQILGDSTLRTVVTTALGIPEQIAFQPLEAQERAISSQIDITKFKNQAFVEQFTKRYLIEAQLASSSTTSSSSSTPALSLLA